MNSTLKTVLPIFLVVVMVFGITVMSQFVAPTKPREVSTEGESVLVLVVGNADRYADPGSPEAVYRYFPGYFEVGSDYKNNRVGFFVRNPRQSSIYLSALQPSCGVCTSARGAAIPADLLNTYLQHAAVAPLWSPMPTPDFLSAIAWHQLQQQLKWTDFVFNDPSSRLELPAASENNETWGLLELGFSMASVGTPLPKHAYFDIYDANNNKLTPRPFEFTVVCGGRELQELARSNFDIGELSENNPSHTIEVYIVSALTKNLPLPNLRSAEPDPHIKIGEPQKMTDEQLEDVSLKLASAANPALKAPVTYLQSGYKFPVTVLRTSNGQTMDVGSFDKELFASGGPGVVLQKAQRIQIHGEVIGAIRLEKGNKIEFGSYDSNYAQKKEVRLWTERPNPKMEVLPELATPSFLKPSLSAPTVEAGRTYWTLTVQIPAKEGRSPPWNGEIVLKSQVPETMTLRVQVTGHGR